MSLAQGNNTPTRPRIEPGSPDPESDALTTRPVRPPTWLVSHVATAEALPGGLGNRGTRAFISGEQENKGQILRGTGEQRIYWGTGNMESKFSIFGEQGNKPIYFRGTREQVSPLGWPHCGARTYTRHSGEMIE